MSILRQALGTQQTPPNQVLIAISLFLTFFIMAPTFNKVYDNAALPYMDKTMPADIALETASTYDYQVSMNTVHTYLLDKKDPIEKLLAA